MTQSHIISEAKIDICPLVRSEVWAALLGVKVQCILHCQQLLHRSFILQLIYLTSPAIKFKAFQMQFLQEGNKGILILNPLSNHLVMMDTANVS